MKTFTIYYGTKPDGDPKIGCDEHYPARAKKQLLTNYYAMEKHNDIDIASAREIELQIQHIGKRDNSNTYKESVELLEKYRVPWNSETGREASLKVQNRGTWSNGDQAARGRRNKGRVREDLTNINKTQKRHLTFEQAEEIRAKYIPRKYTHNKLAKEYNVAEGVIKRICLNLSYTTP
tara:strand:+ start:345 stop:878 length:534 start_codon:yes stop_codon:yes gene_type:complete